MLGATLTFFNETPSGRITSRFSSDFDTIDFSIPSSIQSLGDSFLGIITGVGVVCLQAPWYIFIAVPLTILYLRVQGQYRAVSKEMKIIDSGAKSPLFSHFRETLNGLETVRGYKLQTMLILKHDRLLDESVQSRINWDCANRWLGIRLDCIGALIVAASAFSLLINMGPQTAGGTSGGGKAGLMLSYALKATQSLSFAIRASTALENHFTSIDRVDYFINAPQELAGDERNDAPLHAKNFYGSKYSRNATNKGDTILKGLNVVAQYSPNLPPALKGVTFDLKAGELVGFFGRTGSGKSTLCWILARCMNISEGSVSFYDENVSVVPLREYRNSVHIYPQDCWIFSGELRSYLDPNGIHSDCRLNELLEEFTKVTSDNGIGTSGSGGGVTGETISLNFKITAGGSNFSAGQKQVAILCRAALADASVVVLDEVTSNMDEAAGKKALEILRRELCKRMVAVLLVTHRVSDLERCDSTWEMVDGSLKGREQV